MPLNTPMPPEIKNNPIYKTIWQRLHWRDQNFLIAFTGDTGSGKSFSSIKMAYDMDRDRNGRHRFTVDNIVYTPEQFISKVRGKLPKGSWIVWEETGVGINSRKFYEQVNMLMSYVTQTFRYKNYAVIYNTPSFSYVDKQVRLLYHAMVAMHGVNYEEKYSYGTWYWIEHSKRDSSKPFYVLPRVWRDGRKMKLDTVTFGLAPKELLEEYMTRRDAVNEQRYADYEAEIRAMGVQDKLVNDSDLLAELKKDPGRFWNRKRGRADPSVIKLELNIGYNKANMLARMLDKLVESEGLVV